MAMLRLLARERDAVTLVPPIVVRDELESGDLVEAASRLFDGLRAFDTVPGLAGIAVMPIPDSGLGLAINDRLGRAAAPRPGAASGAS